MANCTPTFSNSLQNKIDFLKSKNKAVNIGGIDFANPLLLAPMSAICTAPYRFLMELLGAGGTVSELISCHGINHGNKRTMDMLKLHPGETFVGLQIFGEEEDAMALAAKKAQEFGPKFVDINMGCPVRKVVTKGGGSALLKNPLTLAHFFRTIKKAIEIPLTIKIRTGWDENSKNAHEILSIAKEEGIAMVAIHGRTRAQQYKGHADWTYLEDLGKKNILPIIGNGDLHHYKNVQMRLSQTNCQALMLGRGPLRDPFIFLKSFDVNDEVTFVPEDYLEVMKFFSAILENHSHSEREHLMQLKKHLVWISSGYPNVSHFRQIVFAQKNVADLLKVSEDFFQGLGPIAKQIDWQQSFMAGGHG